MRPLIVFLFLITVAYGCKAGTSRSKLAEVDGEPILAADFEKNTTKELFRQRERLYRFEKQKLDEYIDAVLLTKEARKRAISVATLLDQEVDSKILAVTDDEIAAFYNVHKGNIRGELNQVRVELSDFLRKQKIDAQRALFLKSLRANANVVTFLKPPAVPRVEISLVGAPFKGPERAAVTIVKFEDFHCPFCKQIQPAFAELLSRYDGKVRLVHKDLPLDSLHPLARQAAEAARCADEQNKFWPFHDKLYTNAPKASVDDLKAYAKEVGLDLAAFGRCLSSGKYRPAVEKDIAEGASLGIGGTPTFFVNGRESSGVQPLESIAQMIEEELSPAR